jgi:hypothetical protein
MNSQNTFHGFTGSFISTVIGNLPNLTGDKMQTWIENPKALQKALKDALDQKVVILEEGMESFHFQIVGHKTSTFDRQTAKFIAVIAQNIPVISTDLMELWIKNRNALKSALTKTLDAKIIITEG